MQQSAQNAEQEQYKPTFFKANNIIDTGFKNFASDAEKNNAHA